MRSRTAALGLLLAAMVASSCSSSDPSPDVEDAPSTTTAATTTSMVSTVEPAADLEEFRTDGDAALLSDHLRDRLLLLPGCDVDTPPPNDLIARLPRQEQRDAATEIFAAIDRADAACADEATWTTALNDTIIQLLALETALDDGILPVLDPPAVGAQGTELIPVLSGMNDRIHTALESPVPLQRTDVWFTYFELGHTLELRRLDPSLDLTLIVGSSIADGIRPDGLVAAQGQTVFNAALPGARLNDPSAWVANIRSLGLTPTTLILVTSTHEVFRCRPGSVVNHRASARAEALAAVAHLEGIDRTDLLLGPAVSSTYPDTWAIRAYDARNAFSPATLDIQNEEARASQLALFQVVYEDPSVCPENLAGITDLIEAQTPFGPTYVVMLPIHPELTALHPDGDQGHEEAFLLTEATVVAAGAEVIDARSAVGADDLADTVHLNIHGSTTVTALVRDHLAG